MMVVDIKQNKKNTKGLFIILFFRISSFFTKNFLLKLIGLPIRISYRVLIIWLMGCDLPDTTKIGKGLRIFHGQGLVVNSETIIGDYVTLRQNTTIGNSKENGSSPIIGNNVEIGANSIILGGINIGTNSVIGAGSVVLQSVMANSMVAGNPAKFKKTLTKI